MEKGDWVEIGDKIFEIRGQLKNDYLVREILHKEPSLKLKYGPVIAISKDDLKGAGEC